MSLPVAIQSAIFYYIACTPCNEARARHKAKRQARQDREEKIRIQTEQPGLYPHPSPYNTNPYWQEEIDMGPQPPKYKAGSKNTSQRGLNSAGTGTGTGTGRNSTSASLTCASSYNENNPTTIPMPTSSIRKPEATHLSETSGDDGWNRRRYQREDEELWGHSYGHGHHDFSRMGHRLVDNIVKAGSSAGRMIKGELSKEKPHVTEDDRTNFYLTPKNPPVNEYHPPIVGSAPAHKNALQWMLQPPPPAKLMEGRVPVNRPDSSSSVTDRAANNSNSSMTRTRARTRSTVTSEETPLGRVARERAMQERLRRQQETPSESELIDALIGTRSRQTTLSSHSHSHRGRDLRSRSLSVDSEKRHSGNLSTDSEFVETRRRSTRSRRRSRLETDDSEEQGGEGDFDFGLDDKNDETGLSLQYSWDSLGGSHPRRTAAQRPKLGTIRSSNSSSVKRTALSNKPNGSRPGSVTPRPSTPTKVTTQSGLTRAGSDADGKTEIVLVSVKV